MEIKKLREDKFEVVLHMEDLDKFNISLSQFMAAKIEDFDFFSVILNYIDKISRFSIRNKKVIFETFFVDDSYFLIELYVVGILSANGVFLPKIGKNFSVSDKVPMIFCFSCFDTVCDFYNYISNFDKQRHLLDFIDFFRYKDKYLLILKTDIFSSDLYDTACLQISEFADFVSCSNILVSKIEELGVSINI